MASAARHILVATEADCAALKKQIVDAVDSSKRVKEQSLCLSLFRMIVIVCLAAGSAGAAFPGNVAKDAPRIEKVVTLTEGRRGWQSTGLYAAPGDVITVEAPQGIKSYNLKLRIGCHKDNLLKMKKKCPLKRPPVITVSSRLIGGSSVHSNQYGGLIYIEVPKKAVDVPALSFRVSGAVAAPYYVHGKTTLSDWKTVRKAPAPWAELESDRVIISVPSELVRYLKNPSALMDFWNEVLDADAELAAIPKERSRPERFVPDVQITGGFMHSGYPIMIELPQAERLVNLKELRRNKNGKVWGLFHELGHNHQSKQWSFKGMGEVTCNLFALYAIEKACDGRNSKMTPKKHRDFPRQYLRDGIGKNKPLLALKNPVMTLVMYMQLQESFGWESFIEVFDSYHENPLPKRKKEPLSDDLVRDEWMVRFSHTVGRNLGPFFEFWTIPTSESARESIAHLPVWMPDEIQ